MTRREKKNQNESDVTESEGEVVLTSSDRQGSERKWRGSDFSNVIASGGTSVC